MLWRSGNSCDLPQIPDLALTQHSWFEPSYELLRWVLYVSAQFKQQVLVLLERTWSPRGLCRFICASRASRWSDRQKGAGRRAAVRSACVQRSVSPDSLSVCSSSSSAKTKWRKRLADVWRQTDLIPAVAAFRTRVESGALLQLFCKSHDHLLTTHMRRFENGHKSLQIKLE